MRYKNKSYSARKPPKILLLGPPCSRKYEMAEIIAKKFNLCHVSISDLLNKEIKANNENSMAILNSMNLGELVNDKYVLKLLEDRLYSSDCMINGWILTGFPKNSAQLNYFELNNPSFKPSLVVIIEHDYKLLIERSSMKRIDPMTGKTYFINSNEFAAVGPAISNRLVIKTEDKPEVFKKRLDNWEKFSSLLGGDIKYNLKRINGEMELDTSIETIVDSMEFASD
jgi:adenylate kinase